MKLQFSKNESGDISAKMQKGTLMEEFDYVYFINQIVENSPIELDFLGLEDQEKNKIETLIEKIKQAIDEGKRLEIEI